MTAHHTKTAQDAGPGRLRNSVRCQGPNNSGDSTKHRDYQVIEDVDAAIEASTEIERILARRWLAQHRLTMGLIIYRDNFSKLGKVAEAFWGGAD
ncbi:MAG TPA: hypothetical protein PKE02_13680 [Methyloceanibacter sp.]|nr:hypothetical protein [Methyloceanibacter sp.]